MIRRRFDNSGQSALEFAITLPIFFMVLLMVVQFAIIFFAKLVVAEAARDGARVASVHQFDQVVSTVTRDAAMLNGSLTTEIHYRKDSTSTWKEYPGSGNPSPGDTVKVLVSHPVKIFVVFLKPLLSDTYPVKSEVLMRVE